MTIAGCDAALRHALTLLDRARDADRLEHQPIIVAAAQVNATIAVAHALGEIASQIALLRTEVPA